MARSPLPWMNTTGVLVARHAPPPNPPCPTFGSKPPSNWTSSPEHLGNVNAPHSKAWAGVGASNAGSRKVPTAARRLPTDEISRWRAPTSFTLRMTCLLMQCRHCCFGHSDLAGGPARMSPRAPTNTARNRCCIAFSLVLPRICRCLPRSYHVHTNKNHQIFFYDRTNEPIPCLLQGNIIFYFGIRQIARFFIKTIVRADLADGFIPSPGRDDSFQRRTARRGVCRKLFPTSVRAAREGSMT